MPNYASNGQTSKINLSNFRVSRCWFFWGTNFVTDPRLGVPSLFLHDDDEMFTQRNWRKKTRSYTKNRVEHKYELIKHLNELGNFKTDVT